MSDNPFPDQYGLRSALNGGYAAGPLVPFKPDWTDRLLGRRQWQPIRPNPQGGGDFLPRSYVDQHSQDLLEGSNPREVIPFWARHQDLTDQYNTQLPPLLESQFQSWLRQSGKQLDLYDYDLRGAWLKGEVGRGDDHMPDTWKKPNHPTFSDQSQYSGEKTPGGKWEQSPDGAWSFTPSEYNLKQHSIDEMQEYWQRAEPPQNKLQIQS